LRPNPLFAFVSLELFSIAFFEYVVFLKIFVFDHYPTLTTKLNREKVLSGMDKIQRQKSAEKLEVLALVYAI
jgi:hypothetical protein